ncbi:peptidase inhibitor family I36 protein [Streptomyces sp. NRRL S-37]|uniref:peptidase inhibitor family I36 protein n=1 Tax=Streptomyces sp. NRRL S-37 TaxID=1463903 RepID=UPI0004C70250|nr:peptidase inhibitor family I36 protein [Streptomyces sp. NRRL S-37]
MKLTVKTAVLGAVLASTAVLAAPGTASAGPKDPLPNNCSQGMICFYDGHDLTGNVVQFFPVQTPNIGWAWNDRASSVWNRSGDELCIWTDVDYNGISFPIAPGATQELLFLYDKAVSGFSINQCGG